MAYKKYTISTLTDEIAPFGYHFTPDGVLTSDAEYEELYGKEVIEGAFDKKFINSLNISQKDIPIGGQSRKYEVKGDEGASYYISVKKGTDGKFYNFNTGTFARGVERFTHQGLGFPLIDAENTLDNDENQLVNITIDDEED